MFSLFFLLWVMFLNFLCGPFLDLSHRLRCLFGAKCNLFSNWSTRAIFTYFFVLPPFSPFPSFKKHIFDFDTEAVCLLKWYQRLGFHWQIIFSLSLFQEMNRFKKQILKSVVLPYSEFGWNIVRKSLLQSWSKSMYRDIVVTQHVVLYCFCVFDGIPYTWYIWFAGAF